MDLKRLRNPFFSRQRVMDPNCFYGRQGEIESLYSAIVTHQCRSIVGERKLGKSSLLTAIAQPAIMAQYGLPLYDTNILTSSRALADYFENCVKLMSPGKAKMVSNWLLGDFSRLLNATNTEIENVKISPTYCALPPSGACCAGCATRVWIWC